MSKLEKEENNPLTFDAIQIGIASPEKILEWSHGEVKKPETINYRTLKPETDGLFCERIFGPSKDWECHCGRYKKIRYKGLVCERCGVEVTKASVRRERLGHITLAAPVSHIWYFNGIPSPMSSILDIPPRNLEKVLYFEAYIVLDPKNTGLTYKQVLSDKEFRDAQEQYGWDSFEVGMGAEAIEKLLKKINLDKEYYEIKSQLENTSAQRRAKLIKRLEVIEAFKNSGNKPEWMILRQIPVIPPDIRPMVQLDGGRFATSDLNDLYRRILYRNNRLAELLEQKTPEIITRNLKRMLQEAVDALIDNGRRGRPVTGPGNRALKSLSDMLKGKQGRFRQNLLGKRVDYSGRSVIVVGPELKIYQCGLPKEMALELFKPFVMKELVSREIAHNIKAAKKMVERVMPEVWDVLEDVITEHPVMLNRASTFQRFGIQAFEPILVEGKAIKLHPLVCKAFNANFYGDQIAVHVPLSVEAQAECRFLLLSPYNLVNIANGKLISPSSQDMVLGIYYLTQQRPGAKGEGKAFRSPNEAILALENKEITLHSLIKVRITKTLDNGEKVTDIIETTVGRILFNEIIPQDLGFVDRTKKENACKLEIDFTVDKGQCERTVERIFDVHGPVKTAKVLDDIKTIGNKYSTVSGISISAFNGGIKNSEKTFTKESIFLDNDILKYFESTQSIRRELSYTVLRKTDLLYFTRRLVDVSHELIIRETDCSEGMQIPFMEISSFSDGKGKIEDLKERITGRYIAEDIVDPDTDEVILAANHMVTPLRVGGVMKALEKQGRNSVKIRTVLTCKCGNGICAKCYGADMATDQTVQVGEAVGIIAAQSIGASNELLNRRVRNSDDYRRKDSSKIEKLFENYKTGMPEINPHDILKLNGVRAVQDYMLREVQRVYRLQGVEINDKHIEVIVRQMLRKITIEESGDSGILHGITMDVLEFNRINEQMEAEGKTPASGTQIMLGITKASLATESFLSAASFKETTKVLTEAAINGKIDHLSGLKENVIIGKLIPAGTGMKRYRNQGLNTESYNDDCYDNHDDDSDDNCDYDVIYKTQNINAPNTEIDNSFVAEKNQNEIVSENYENGDSKNEQIQEECNCEDISVLMNKITQMDSIKEMLEYMKTVQRDKVPNELIDKLELKYALVERPYGKVPRTGIKVICEFFELNYEDYIINCD